MKRGHETHFIPHPARRNVARTQNRTTSKSYKKMMASLSGKMKTLFVEDIADAIILAVLHRSTSI